ncbi:MAG: hypothetical protein N2327_04860 [Caldimicrobium sp.]|nr:hypothetical protein [Caldimicrobium sp.]MCX7873742.1 hypothetical protein [Caldimicrobium sp.]MDW8093666.1 hypothetical protein [Caldimicrobium sp.]
MRDRLRLYKFLTWLKELQEEQAKVRVFNAKINLQKLREEKEILSEEYQESQNYLKEKRNLRGEELKNWFLYLNRLSEFLNIVDRKIESQEMALQELVEDFMNKHREKRIMERLYQRATKASKEVEFKKALKILDDLILLRKGRDIA